MVIATGAHGAWPCTSGTSHAIRVASRSSPSSWFSRLTEPSWLAVRFGRAEPGQVRFLRLVRAGNVWWVRWERAGRACTLTSTCARAHTQLRLAHPGRGQQRRLWVQEYCAVHRFSHPGHHVVRCYPAPRDYPGRLCQPPTNLPLPRAAVQDCEPHHLHRQELGHACREGVRRRRRQVWKPREHRARQPLSLTVWKYAGLHSAPRVTAVRGRMHRMPAVA